MTRISQSLVMLIVCSSIVHSSTSGSKSKSVLPYDLSRYPMNIARDVPDDIDELLQGEDDMADINVENERSVPTEQTMTLKSPPLRDCEGPPEQGFARDCADLMTHGVNVSGIYTIFVGGMTPLLVYCDMTTDGGGWTVIQRRFNGSESFYRTWNEYAAGFGKISEGGEYWLGNDNIRSLTVEKRYTLRIDLSDFSGNVRYAQYTNFVIGAACEKYRLLSLGTYSGTAGDSLVYHLGQEFTTYDQDNDPWASNCALQFKGAWWYRSCHHSNLNGLYLKGPHTSYADGVEWYHWLGHYYSLKTSTMKIRAN